MRLVAVLLVAFSFSCLELRDKPGQGYTSPATQENSVEEPKWPQNEVRVNDRTFPYTESGLALAISAAGENATVFVPRGTIQLSTPLAISSNARVYWDGVTLASRQYSGDLIDLRNVANVSFGGKLILDGSQSGTAATSQGITLTRVDNFTFDELSVKSVVNSCVEVLGSSFVTGNKIFCTGGDRGHGSSSSGIFIANDGPTPTTDLTIHQIVVKGQPNGDCVYLANNYKGPTGEPRQNVRINVDKIDLLSCGDSGLEIDHTSGNFGEIDVAANGVLNSAVLIRNTVDDNINSVICGGGFKLCVDIATFSTQDTQVDGITIGQIIAKDVDTDSVNGAAVRISSNGPAAVSDLSFGSIITSGSSRGFYCAGAGAGGGPAQHIVVNNLVSHHQMREGVLIWGCRDVVLDNIICYDNGQHYHGVSGIRGAAATDVVLGNVRVFDDQSRKTQDYGISTDGWSDRWTVELADARDDLEIKSGLSLGGVGNIVFRRTGPSSEVQVLGRLRGFDSH